jgi:O-antigen/teichoic acid export membrane protein
MLNRIRQLTAQSGLYGIGNLLPKAIGFILIPLYTRYLTPADYGILAFATTIIAILGILFEFGLGSALTRFYYDTRHNIAETKKLVGSLWIFLTFIPLAVTLIITVRGGKLFDALFTNTPFDPYGKLSIWIAYFTLASVIPLTMFRVQEKVKHYVIFTFGRFLVLTFSIIYFVVGRGLGAEGSLTGQLIVSAIFALLFTIISLANSSIPNRLSQLKAALAYGSPLILHQLSAWALSVSDRLLLERQVTLEQLGIYALGYRLAMILDLIFYSFNLAWAPFYFQTASTDENAPAFFSRLATYYALVVYCFGLALAVLADPLIRIMANPAFHPAAQVVPVVVLAYVAHGFYYFVVNQLFFARQTGSLALYTTLAAAVNIILNIVTIPRYGIQAAAWNTFIGYLVLTILVFRKANRVYPIAYEKSRLLLSGLITLGVFVLSTFISISNAYIDLLVGLLLVISVPFILALFRFYTVQEMKAIKSLPGRTWNKIVPHR